MPGGGPPQPQHIQHIHQLTLQDSEHDINCLFASHLYSGITILFLCCLYVITLLHLKELLQFYCDHGSTMFVCFLDASKAFDHVNYTCLLYTSDAADE